MPELPEVETTRRGIAPHVEGRIIRKLDVREPRLRWPVPDDLAARMADQQIKSIYRRAKYLIFDTDAGSMLLHLGMSGRLQVMPAGTPPKKHDHVDIVLDSDDIVRLHDPRRFGSLLYSQQPETHPLIANLGPEPLSEAFDGNHLYARSRGRRVPIKSFIMDAKVVVGVGNIYASEALFMAGIHPLRAAGKLSRPRMQRLADTIREVLSRAIDAGGTTLRDFYGTDGSAGYFSQQLAVYGRASAPCVTCAKPVSQRVIGQRSTFYCTHCQR
ncbi:MAG: bifunctional DNA-formamidopyrimidine glycosylase/DNA-(apurinic or apyrimidinic site) lyase [Pseudomonadota bacterium]